MSRDRATESKVVAVGVDGSEASQDALRWALRYARLTGATVRPLTAWEYPDNFAWAALPEIDLEGDARRALKQTIEDVSDPHEPVPVSAEVVEGHPRQVLLTASEQAALLVVGSRGHGRFTGMLLGSVSDYCVHHARCPVVVVRHREP